MKLLLFATALVMAAYVAAKPGNQGPALSGEGLVKREEWSTLSKTVNGHELLFGCDRRHTLSGDGKCWSYCGADWVGIKSIKTWLTVNSQNYNSKTNNTPFHNTNWCSSQKSSLLRGGRIGK
jgi:hypothetical protein